MGRLYRWPALIFVTAAVAGCHSQPDVRLPSTPRVPEYVPQRQSQNAFDGYALAALSVEKSDPAQLTEVSFYPGQKKTAIAACDADVSAIKSSSLLPCDFKFVPRGPFDVHPYQAGWRLLGHVMRWKIDDACLAENWDAAIDIAIMATRFGFDLTGGGPSDASLGFAIVDDVRVAIVPYLLKMGAAQLQRLADGIGGDLKRKPPISTAIQHDGQDIQLAIEALQRATEANDYQEISHYLGSDVKEAIEYLQGIRGNGAKLNEYFRQFSEEGLSQNRYLLSVAPLPRAQRQDPPKSKLKERPWKHFAHHFFSASAPLMQMDDRTVARTRLLVLSSELIKSAKLGTGYPKDLSAFDHDVTIDPYSGERFRYRADETEFLIYSVGDNLRDDGGDTDDSFTTPDLRLELKP